MPLLLENARRARNHIGELVDLFVMLADLRVMRRLALRKQLQLPLDPFEAIFRCHDLLPACWPETLSIWALQQGIYEMQLFKDSKVAGIARNQRLDVVIQQGCDWISVEQPSAAEPIFTDQRQGAASGSGFSD